MANRVGRTTALYFVSRIATSLVGFLATWIIANQLGSTILGEYTVVVALLFWLSVPSSAIASATNKRISEKGEYREYSAAGHIINLSLITIIGIVMLFFTEQVTALTNGREVIWLLIFLLLTKSVFDVVLGTLRGIKRVDLSGILMTTERVLRSSFQIGAIIVGAGFTWLIIGHVAALIIAALIGIAILPRMATLPSQNEFKRILEYARYSWLGTLKTRSFAWMDTIVLSVFAAYAGFGIVNVSHSQIGIYEAAWSIASVLALFSISIKDTLFPEISALGEDDRTAEIRHYVEEALAFTGLLIIPGFFGGIVVGEEVLAIYGAEFSQGHWILVILVLGRLFSAFSTQLLSAINAIDRPDVAFRINAIFLGFNFVANIALIGIFGWMGAAVATTISAFFGLILGGYFLSDLLDGLSVPFPEIGVQILASALMFVVLELLSNYRPRGTASLLLFIGFGAVVYAVTIGALSPRVRQKVFSTVSN